MTQPADITLAALVADANLAVATVRACQQRFNTVDSRDGATATAVLASRDAALAEFGRLSDEIRRRTGLKDIRPVLNGAA